MKDTLASLTLLILLTGRNPPGKDPYMVLLRGSYLHAEITQVLIEGLEESIRIMGPEGLQDILVVFAVIADMQDTRVHSPAELSIGTAHAAHAGRTDPRNGLHGTYCDCLCRGEGEKPL